MKLHNSKDSKVCLEYCLTGHCENNRFQIANMKHCDPTLVSCVRNLCVLVSKKWAEGL